jgi:hypothetical protein
MLLLEDKGPKVSESHQYIGLTSLHQIAPKVIIRNNINMVKLKVTEVTFAVILQFKIYFYQVL